MPDNRILLGVIGRPHGVSGRVHVTSHTADPADLTAYGPLSSADGRLFDVRWTSEGIAELREVIDGTPVKVANRTAAEKLTNVELFIDRSLLPPPDEDEFYLADLVGLTAVDAAGETLGTVATVHDYGAGASLEIEGPKPAIVPFTRACVPEVDIPARRIVVALPEEVLVTAEGAAAA